MLCRPACLCRKRGVGAPRRFLSPHRIAPSAVRAYRDAALACFNGDYYDYGTEMLPCRFLRLRFLRMVEAAVACCADDARLRALVTDDPLFREEYPLLKAGF